ncbi:virulence-associated E family protein [Myxococcota bacterium]|nr:virulence-associated E family protein [Myxococcota bacterium]
MNGTAEYAATTPAGPARSPAASQDETPPAGARGWDFGVEVVAPDPVVQAALDCRPSDHGRGRPYPTKSNVDIVLRGDPRWAGRLRLNQFDGCAYLDAESVRDSTETLVSMWIERVYGVEIATAKVGEVMRTVAESHTFHAVREYLSELEWDGHSRAELLLTEYLGAEDTRLHREIAVRFLLSAVARILSPGCKVDTVLVLVGGQGAGKSTALRTLAVRPEWFSDSLIDFRNKDALQGLRGVWLWELAELDAIHRSEASAVKAFLTAREDWFRPPYGRNFVRWKRQTVFVASTNEGAFLKDPTGSRRFWPVRVREIDTAGLEADRDQVWAEAVARYTAGETWWLSAEGERELAEVSRLYEQESPWEDRLADWVHRQVVPFTLGDAMGALDIPPAQQDRHKAHVASLLEHRLKCTKSRTTQGGRRAMRYAPPRREE